MSPSQAVGSHGAGEGLDGHVGDSEEDSGGRAEHHAVVLVGVEGRGEHEEGADGEQRGLEGHHAGHRVAGVGSLAAGQRGREEHEAEGGEADAGPLAEADGAAEPALGDDGEEDEATGDHCLDEREGREGEGADVEDPRPEGHEHADREPLGPEQAHSAANRMAQADVGGRARTAMLQQEAEVRGQGAEERKENAYFNSHVEGVRIQVGKGGLAEGSRWRRSLSAIRGIGRRACRLNEKAPKSYFCSYPGYGIAIPQ